MLLKLCAVVAVEKKRAPGTPGVELEGVAQLAAFYRIDALAPLAGARISSAAGRPLRHIQHTIATIADGAQAARVVSMITALDNPRLPRHMELYHSSCGDPATFGFVPSPDTSISYRSFEQGFARRLLLPISPLTWSEQQQCPACSMCSSGPSPLTSDP